MNQSTVPICPLCSSSKARSIHSQKDVHFGMQEYFDCNECGLVFMDPKCRLNATQEKDRYDQHNNDPSDERYINFLERLTVPLEKKLSSSASGIDFGCGPGPAIQLILEDKGFNVVNYDPFYEPHIKLLDQQYDFVTSTEVIEHIHNPRQDFETLNSLLKDGGFVGLMTSIYYDDIEFSDWWYIKDPTHVCFYREGTFEWIGEWLNWKLEFPSKNVIIGEKK